MKTMSGLLKQGGKYFLGCFSDKNPTWEKNVSKKEIMDNFSGYFDIGRIKELISAMQTLGEIITSIKKARRIGRV